MARTPDFPTRVLAIAVVIAVLLGLLVWLLSGLGAPATTPSAGVDAAADVDQADAGAGAAAAAGVGVGVEGEIGEPAADDLAVAEPGIEDEATVLEGDALTLQLYLVEGASRQLVPRLRRIRAPYPLATQAQMALDALINAGEPGYASPLPSETVVREVWVTPDSGTAYVDLARGFQELLGGGSRAEIHAVYGIVGTLTATFPEIRQVQILVEGRPVDTLNGHLDVSVPVRPLRDWL